MLLPALVASVSGYLTFVAIHGTAALPTVTGTPPFSLEDLAAAAALGAIAGVGARAFAWMLRRAKYVSANVSVWLRVPAAGASVTAIFCLVRLVGGQNLTTGPGYDTIRWALDPTRGLWIVAAILVLRCIATSATFAGGGVGGLFIPLVVAGAAGRIVGGTVNALDTTLFTVVGAAALLARVIGSRSPR